MDKQIYNPKFDFSLWIIGWPAVDSFGNLTRFVATNPYARNNFKYIGAHVNFESSFESYDEDGSTQIEDYRLHLILPPFANFAPGDMVAVWNKGKASSAVMRRFLEFQQDFSCIAYDNNGNPKTWDFVLSVDDYKKGVYKNKDWNSVKRVGFE